jgi:hypothetical protein
MVLRAITVKSPAKMAAMEKTQKKTASQPDRIIYDFRLQIEPIKPPRAPSEINLPRVYADKRGSDQRIFDNPGRCFFRFVQSAFIRG